MKDISNATIGSVELFIEQQKRLMRNEIQSINNVVRSCLLLFFIITLVIGFTTICHAQWVKDGTVIREMVNAQYPPGVVSDGAGGAIIAWKDFRYGGWDLFAQRIDPDGVLLWEEGGVPLCMEEGSQHRITLVKDGEGGAVAVWLDMRRGWNIYAQRISPEGVMLWRSYGNPVCTVPGQKACLESTDDGSGGAVAVWVDYRNNIKELFAQRVNGEGRIYWGTDGLAVCGASDHQWRPYVASDGDGGIITAWQDHRNGNWDIYAQKVSRSGVIQWNESGVQVSSTPSDDFFPVVVSDDSGGAIVAWHVRTNDGRDVFAQRIDASGKSTWRERGVPIGSAGGDQMKPQITVDTGGGIVIAWVDTRNGNRDIYAQRVDASGAIGWIEDGIGVCTYEEDQWSPSIISDGALGVIIAWHDMRIDYRNIYVQKIDLDGSVQWIDDGEAVCTAVEPQVWPRIVTDGAGGAIVVWVDLRKNDYSADIYAEKIDAEGVLGHEGREPVVE
jgi:hypothetical protein